MSLQGNRDLIFRTHTYSNWLYTPSLDFQVQAEPHPRKSRPSTIARGVAPFEKRPITQTIFTECSGSRCDESGVLGQ